MPDDELPDGLIGPMPSSGDDDGWVGDRVFVEHSKRSSLVEEIQARIEVLEAGLDGGRRFSRLLIAEGGISGGRVIELLKEARVPKVVPGLRSRGPDLRRGRRW